MVLGEELGLSDYELIGFHLELGDEFEVTFLFNILIRLKNALLGSCEIDG